MINVTFFYIDLRCEISPETAEDELGADEVGAVLRELRGGVAVHAQAPVRVVHRAVQLRELTGSGRFYKV